MHFTSYINMIFVLQYSAHYFFDSVRNDDKSLPTKHDSERNIT